MKRPIIFLVSHSAMGGVQEIWTDLAEGFAKKDCNVKLIALYPDENAVPRPADTLEWQFIMQGRPKSVFGGLKMLWTLAREIRRSAPAKIFSAMPAANVMASIGAILAATGTRVIVSHHTPVQSHNGILNALDTLLGRFTIVEAVVAVSRAVAASLERKPAAYRSKVLVISNALPPRIERELESLTPRTVREHAECRVVMAIGRLAEQKNLSVLVRAAVWMPDVEVHFVGEGPLEAELTALAAEIGVSDRVKFLGKKSRLDALRLLANGSVFCQPSLFEGHSLALIEAAKLKLPLVVSDVAVQIEGITARDGSLCGVAVPTHDDKRLAATILRLLDNATAYREASAKAERLAADATYERLIQSYRDLS